MATPKFQLNITQDDITPYASPYEAGQPTSYALAIDGEEETISIDETRPGETGVSFREWHGFYMIVPIAQEWDDQTQYPDANDLANLIETDEAQAIIQRICDGISVEWDGSNNRAAYNDDAHKAAEELAELIASLDAESYNVWEADDWLQGVGAADYYITAQTTDEQLAEIAATIVQDAYNDSGDFGHVIVEHGDILRTLTGWRNDRRDEEDE